MNSRFSVRTHLAKLQVNGPVDAHLKQVNNTYFISCKNQLSINKCLEDYTYINEKNQSVIKLSLTLG